MNRRQRFTESRDNTHGSHAPDADKIQELDLYSSLLCYGWFMDTTERRIPGECTKKVTSIEDAKE